MGEKIIVGPVNRGLRTDRTPFVIDNDSFPTLQNAYQWRGRVKRKRGTSLLGRLKRFFSSGDSAYTPTNITIVLVNDGFGNGTGNLLTSFATLQPNSTILPGSVGIIDFTNGQSYNDNSVGTLIGTLGGTGTLNYVTGEFVLTGRAGDTVAAAFSYYPDLPVMGLEDLALVSTQFPGTIAFDTVYSYNISTSSPFNIYDVSFYKNPALDPIGLPGYLLKTSWTPTTWNGQNYQQFWTTNYQGALWETNGIDTDPVTLSRIGMQFAPASAITYVGNTATTLTVTIANCPLVIGDFVFVNEWVGPSVVASTSINYQSGYVTAAAPNTPVLALKTITITFPFATILAGPYTPGIIQYLTNRSDITKDCLRWYDGDPTNGISPVPASSKGWVNFAPPLNNIILFPFFSISDLPPAQYYLVGARMIVPFKDRLLFLGPVIQTSTGTPIYLQDTIIFSQNGTPYYTASFTGDPSLATTVFHPILVPDNQTASPVAYWEDLTGYGGFISAGVEIPIITVGSNEDVLVVGFSTIQTKLVSTGDGITPFLFYTTNSELGSGSTFSIIQLDKGVLTRGNRGYITSDQSGAERFDLDILDQVFQINLQDHGSERFTAQRDFINEWIYFTYPSNEFINYTNLDPYTFPNQTLFYNYRDQSWSIFNETYTTYGQFRKSDGLTWNSAPIWNNWHDPWNSGSITVRNQEVIAGNQQGFVIIREDEDTTEALSLYIQGFSSNTITSPKHCLNNGDYIRIFGAIGTIGTIVNFNISKAIYQISNATANTFDVDAFPVLTGTYFGGGLIERMYIPLIQTKQFPVNWAMARKTRLGPQQYLLSTTAKAQMTLLIFLSQNQSSAYNLGNIVPQLNVVNDSLIYSTILYTCPESTNLGLLASSTNMLNPANTNLQMVTASQQQQTWHRINTSLIGDTIQIGFTLSDSQMRDLDDDGNLISQFEEIEIHGFILDVTESMILA